MNKNNTLFDLINKKIERQTRLKEKQKELQELEFNIKGSKIFRWFGTSYLIFKKYLALIFGVSFILLAASLLVYPKSFLQDKQFRNEMIQESRTNYSEMVGSTLEETLSKLSKNNSDFTIEEILKQLDLSINESIEKEIITSIQSIAIPVIFLAFGLLYIARMTRKMQIRNRKISNIENVVQEVISNFKATIKEEEQELVILQAMIKESIN